MSAHVYRMRVSTDVELRADRPLTREEIAAAGRLIAEGKPSYEHGAAPIEDTIDVEIRPAECVDSDHRRNSVDGRTYACGMPSTDAIHETVEWCERESGRPCPDPAEHHPYVSPGFEDPVE